MNIPPYTHRAAGPASPAAHDAGPGDDPQAGTSTSPGGVLAGLPRSGETAALPDLRAVGTDWAGAVMNCFKRYRLVAGLSSAGNGALVALVNAMYLISPLHNLLAQAIRRIAVAVSLPGTAEPGVPVPGELLIVDEHQGRLVDTCLRLPSSNFFVLRALLGRQLPDVEAGLCDALRSLGRPEHAERVSGCLQTAARLLVGPDFDRALATTALSAMSQVIREADDCVRFHALDIDDDQPPLEAVMSGALPPAELGAWLIRTRGDMVQLEAVDFYEDRSRPGQPAAGHERALERLRRKVEQSLRVIDRMHPHRTRQAPETDLADAWRDAIAGLRDAATPRLRKDRFRQATNLLGKCLKAALESLPEPGPVPVREAAQALALPPPTLPRPAADVVPPTHARAPVSHLSRQASAGIWLDLQSVQKKIGLLHETPPADAAAALDGLLPHIDELSRNNRSIGLLFIRQLVLCADRQPDNALYDRALFSAACSLDVMPIDAFAARFFDSPLAHVLALLRGLRRAAPEQADLFLQTLDLCLVRSGQQRLPALLATELKAMREPPTEEFQREAARFCLASLLQALAPHLACDHAAGLAAGLADAFGRELPARALRNESSLMDFACALVLESRHFHHPDLPRSDRFPAHAWLNLHDADRLAVPLLQTAAAAAGKRALRVTVGGFNHQRGEQMPATRRAVLAWASAHGWQVQECSGTELWLFRQAVQRLPGRPLSALP